MFCSPNGEFSESSLNILSLTDLYTCNFSSYGLSQEAKSLHLLCFLLPACMNSLLKELNRCLRELHAHMPLWEAAISDHFQELWAFRRHQRRLQRWMRLSPPVSSSARLPPNFFDHTHRLCGHKLRARMLASGDRVLEVFSERLTPVCSNIEAAVDRLADRMARNSHLLSHEDLFDGPLPTADLVAQLVALQNLVVLEKLRCAATQDALLQVEVGPKPQRLEPESCAIWRLLSLLLKGYKDADSACPYEVPVTATAAGLSSELG